MSKSPYPGFDAIAVKGWIPAHKWLILRRISQLSVLALFLAGPLLGIWIVKGNLNSSLTLETLPLTDPYLLLQSLAAGHVLETTAIIGALIVVAFYILLGGRLYCSWVCPVNLITDLAHWLREKINLRGTSNLPRYTRYLLLAATLVVAAITGNITWEAINPVSMFHRGLIFGPGLAWLILLAVFLFDLLISRRGWCGHLCPVGAFYSLLGSHSLLRVRADARESCNDCAECYLVCPEQQVIRPVLSSRNKSNNIDPVILSPNCTNCGRCIDVCSKNVFHFGLRFHNSGPVGSNNNYAANHSSGV